jgi:signal transduction histidine kinase
MRSNNLLKTNKEQIITLLDQSYALRVNDLPKSFALAEEALQMSTEIEDKKLIGKSLNLLSLYYMIVSDFEESNKKSEEAILYFKELNYEKGIADAKYNIGSVHYKTNNYHLGLMYLIDALKIYKKHQDLYNQSKVEKAIGTIYEYIGDYNNAFKSFKSSIRVAKRINDINLESNVYNNLSGLLIKKNKDKLAMQIIEYSMDLKKRTNDIRGFAFAIYGRGKVHYKNGNMQQAEADFLEAAKIHIAMGEKMGTAMAYNKLGVLYLKENLFEKAESITKEGLELSIKYNISMIKIKNYHLLYQIHKLSNYKLKALEYLESYIKEKESVINTQTLKVIENYELIHKMNTLDREAILQKERQTLIDKKNKDDEESVRLKQKFISIMSHEIRTPLNAITTIISILENQVDVESQKMIKKLQFASNNLINIVNDILDFNKLDSKKSKLEVYPSNFKELCDNICNTYEGMAKEKGIEVVFQNDILKNKIYLVDETKVTQILGNLISNAIKFTEKGKVEFRAKIIEERKNHDLLELRVIDSGEGISKEDLSDIFVSFSQIKPVTTRKQGGTGLGLAIVKMLVELHKSEIKVVSKVGEGSEFFFILKLKKAKEIVIEKEEKLFNLNNRKVLIVEDTPINAFLLKKVLSKWGIQTDHVLNGKLAVETVQSKKYDLILMDIHMPEMNGFEATKHIRQNTNKNSNTPIFAVTADIMTKNDQENFHFFNGLILKPLEIEKLYSILSKEIQKGDDLKFAI